MFKRILVVLAAFVALTMLGGTAQASTPTPRPTPTPTSGHLSVGCGPDEYVHIRVTGLSYIVPRGPGGTPSGPYDTFYLHTNAFGDSPKIPEPPYTDFNLDLDTYLPTLTNGAVTVDVRIVEEPSYDDRYSFLPGRMLPCVKRG